VLARFVLVSRKSEELHVITILLVVLWLTVYLWSNLHWYFTSCKIFLKQPVIRKEGPYPSISLSPVLVIYQHLLQPFVARLAAVSTSWVCWFIRIVCRCPWNLWH
jgi:hypothetical protein